MTERTEVRFNVYTLSNSSIGNNTILPFNLVNFDVGGSYSTITYKYTFLNSGTFLIGLSYTKNNPAGSGTARIFLERDGVSSVISFSQKEAGSFQRSTINQCFMYKFVLGDIIYVQSLYGAPKMNNEVVPVDDIYNSFWGIRLDY